MDGCIEASVDGLLLHELHVDETGDIQLEGNGEIVRIGSMSKLLEAPEFDDGEYETENGFILCVEEFIENIRVDEEMVTEIVKAEPVMRDDSLPFSERLTVFYGLLYVRLRGSHVNQTPAEHCCEG
jgi:hypothetical protein